MGVGRCHSVFWYLVKEQMFLFFQFEKKTVSQLVDNPQTHVTDRSSDIIEETYILKKYIFFLFSVDIKRT